MALTDNIVSYWKFDESSGNASDSVGSLTLTNTSVTYDAGKINNGADCGTGVSSNVGFVGGTPVWNMAGSTAKSMAFWFKPNANATAFARIIDWRRSATSSGEFTMAYYDDSGYKLQGYLNGNTFSYTTTLTVDTWYHIAMTCDASNSVKIYINASQVTTGTWGTAGAGSNFTQINGANGSMSGGFSGPFSFDEMGVWNRELSGSEVTSLYNGGTGIQYPFITAITFAISETLALTESISNLRTRLFSTSETITLTETISVLKGIAFTVAEALGLVETFTSTRTRLFTVAESLGLVEVMARIKLLWTNSTKENTTWTDQSKNSTNWTNQTKA